MRHVKTVLFALCFGIIMGGTVASLIAPGVINWYNIPGGGDAMCHCSDLVRATTESLLRAQMAGCAVGGVTFFFVGLLLANRRRPAAPLATPLVMPPSS